MLLGFLQSEVLIIKSITEPSKQREGRKSQTEPSISVLNTATGPEGAPEDTSWQGSLREGRRMGAA